MSAIWAQLRRLLGEWLARDPDGDLMAQIHRTWER